MFSYYGSIDFFIGLPFTLLILVPLMIYYGYKAKEKFNINLIGLFKLQVPLFIIILPLFIFGLILSLFGITIYPNGMHVWHYGSLLLFQTSLLAIAEIITIFLGFSLLGYLIQTKTSQKIQKLLSIMVLPVLLILFSGLEVISIMNYYCRDCSAIIGLSAFWFISVLYVLYVVYRQKNETDVNDKKIILSIFVLLLVISITFILSKSYFVDHYNYMPNLLYEIIGLVLIGLVGFFLGAKISIYKDKKKNQPILKIGLAIVFMFIPYFLSFEVLKIDKSISFFFSIILLTVISFIIYHIFSVKRKKAAETASLSLAIIASFVLPSLSSDLIINLLLSPLFLLPYFSIYFPIAFLGTFLSDLIGNKK